MNFEEMVSKANWEELEKMEQAIKTRKIQLKPFAELKSLSNRAFGEGWSEPYIRAHVPNLEKNNGTGHDMRGRHYKNIEVKSSRLTFQGNWTMNQVHCDDADAFLFVWYNCENGTQEICFIPTEELIANCTRSRQHVREGKTCCTVGATIKNRKALRNYMVSSWEELNEKV